jgi:hypothetical protein
VVNIHGTQLKLTVAHFTKEYFCAVNSAVMPTDQTLRVRQPQPFDRSASTGVQVVHRANHLSLQQRESGGRFIAENF